MGLDYIDSARAAAEADRIISVAEENLKQVILSLKSCLQVVHMTRQMLEVDRKCICVNTNGGESRWDRRRELDRAAHCIETGIEVALYNDAIVELGLDAKSDDKLVVQPKRGSDNNLMWCDHVCVYEKVDMDSAVWCTTPPTIMELVFARLPLDQMFRMRCLSKHWRDSIMSPSFQHAFGTTTSRWLAFVNIAQTNGLWSFGSRERKWYTLPYNFLPKQCNFPFVEDGGLLCCQDVTGINFHKNLYVCNPLTQAWREIPLPPQVQGFDLVHMVTNTETKQYTITVVGDVHLNKHHQSASAKAVVMVYDSATKTWSASSGGVFQSSGSNLVYYKKYDALERFVGIRVYNKTTGYSTSIPFDFWDDISSETHDFQRLAVYQGQVYGLRTEEAKSGIWILRSPSHVWEKLYSVPKPEVLKYYLFSIVVSADNIIVFGDYRSSYCDAMEIPENPFERDPDEPENMYFWMLDRAEGTWIDMECPGVSSLLVCRWLQILLEMRLDAIP